MSPALPSPKPDDGGAAAIEFAILFPVVLLCIFGLGEFGRAMWSQATLDYAVQAASRCAAIDKINCATVAQTQQYAVTMAPGLPVTSSLFTVVTASCGIKVSASMPFEFVAAALFPYSMTLTASACFPH